jgi:hypothetical protein
MVTANSTPDESYLGRAQALLAARADLFGTASARSTRPAGTPGPPSDRARADRRSSRQLSLPLPRERGLRRARMVR